MWTNNNTEETLLFILMKKMDVSNVMRFINANNILHFTDANSILYYADTTFFGRRIFSLIFYTCVDFTAHSFMINLLDCLIVPIPLLVATLSSNKGVEDVNSIFFRNDVFISTTCNLKKGPRSVEYHKCTERPDWQCWTDFAYVWLIS